LQMLVPGLGRPVAFHNATARNRSVTSWTPGAFQTSSWRINL
jgi:hypothetical protein